MIRPESPETATRCAKCTLRRSPATMWYLTSSTRCAPAGPALPPVSLVSTVDDRVVGHLRLSACRLDTTPRLVDVFSLSPLGVLPEFQRRGTGTALVARVLAEADARGVPLVFLEGSPRYYGTRGFQDARTPPESRLWATEFERIGAQIVGRR